MFGHSSSDKEISTAKKISLRNKHTAKSRPDFEVKWHHGKKVYPARQVERFPCTEQKEEVISVSQGVNQDPWAFFGQNVSNGIQNKPTNWACYRKKLAGPNSWKFKNDFVSEKKIRLSKLDDIKHKTSSTEVKGT